MLVFFFPSCPLREMSNPNTGSPERPSTEQTEQTVMEPYIPFMDGPPHPTGVRQTTVSQLAKPDAMTPEEIDRLVLFSLRTGGSVSAVQLDAVALAAKCFESETAFIVGDATGLGKGRTAVAILRNSWLTRDAGKTGRRALYFSTPQLFATLQRDVVDLPIIRDEPPLHLFDTYLDTINVTRKHPEQYEDAIHPGRVVQKRHAQMLLDMHCRQNREPVDVGTLDI